MKKTFRCMFLVMAMGVPLLPLGAQEVKITINFPAYDVMFLTDFIDVTTQKLSPNIPGVSMELVTTPDTLTIYLKVRAFVQLKGKSEELLVDAETKPFRPGAFRVVSSRDFASGSTSDIQVKSGYFENKSLRQELEDYAKRFPTAPVGTYRVAMDAYGVVNNARVGGASKTIEIRNASVSEVQVTLIDPQQGATLQTTLPTFSWNSEKPKVTLYIFEKLPIHRSPEEAVTGIPHLKVDLSGVSTFTYPSNAPRRLEENKGYYWYVETSVTTNRGIEKRQSEIRFFRIVPASAGTDAASNPFIALLQRLGEGDENLRSALNRLLTAEWQPTGTVLIDGRRITQEEFVQLVNRLVQSGTRIQVKAEDR
jgi:hypothetical protein